MEPQEKLNRLKMNLRNLDGLVVAFSGGVDSSFLLNVAWDVLGDRAVGVTASSETYPSRQLDEAKEVAREIGARHIIIETSELENEEFAQNPPERCYFCKKELFKSLMEVAESLDIGHIADGTIYDDLGDYRPGMKAAEELEVISPLLEAQLTKKDIRQLSREMGLSTWDKPSFACLSSRFPYGREITAERLRRVDRAEEFLRALQPGQLRTRHHDDHTLRIEVDPGSFGVLLKERERIVGAMKELGYTYVTLDLEGYRTGSMNEVLGKERRDE